MLCCDRWEHAYFLQYKGQADRYQEAWWQLVDWKAAGERYRQREDILQSMAGQSTRRAYG